jgi:hypothetical protein
MSEKADKLARSLAPGMNAHRLVAATAVEMAQELFEVYARENDIYRSLIRGGQVTEKAARKRFVKRVAPKFLEEARKALSQMLIQEHVSQMAKDEIYEALILDNDMRANRLVDKTKAVVPTPALH